MKNKDISEVWKTVVNGDILLKKLFTELENKDTS